MRDLTPTEQRYDIRKTLSRVFGIGNKRYLHLISGEYDKEFSKHLKSEFGIKSNNDDYFATLKDYSEYRKEAAAFCGLSDKQEKSLMKFLKERLA